MQPRLSPVVVMRLKLWTRIQRGLLNNLIRLFPIRLVKRWARFCARPRGQFLPRFRILQLVHARIRPRTLTYFRPHARIHQRHLRRRRLVG